MHGSASRREFLRWLGVGALGWPALPDALARGWDPLAAGAGVGPATVRYHASSSASGRQVAAGKRPPPSKRRFTSPAVEATIRDVTARLEDRPRLAWLFENCFPNTLDTTVEVGERDGKPDTFVITGDIEAMWLRDSSAQVWPYVPLAKGDEALRGMLEGVIRRQTACIRIDPHANAFNKGPTGSEWDKDLTAMKPELHERKWEVDSLCYPIRLAHGYWQATDDVSPFDDGWRAAMRLVLRTFREQQRKHGPGPYRFQRVTARATDTVPGDGFGNPVRPVGLICSIFRPSDDATIFPFLVPSNLFAVKSLRQMAEIARDRRVGDADLAAQAGALADEVAAALRAHAVVAHPKLGRVWAYEVDGYGNRLFMDDANVPSLLALPYLGCAAPDDPLYRRTRALALGRWNPWFFSGKAAEGVGSPHTGVRRVWPLAMIMRALTSTSDDEIRACVRSLETTDAGTGFMHESFDVDDPTDFTRAWFAWANTLFGELVWKLVRERPQVLDS
ncbi:MAG TPA: glycoside hydrolase family 125 protein [Longimicrobiales bacterium]|nr:glycoside hydrolase family 125 protein [Longimicrobiales bacterium]